MVVPNSMEPRAPHKRITIGDEGSLEPKEEGGPTPFKRSGLLLLQEPILPVSYSPYSGDGWTMKYLVAALASRNGSCRHDATKIMTARCHFKAFCLHNVANT